MFLWEGLADMPKDFQAPGDFFPTESSVLKFLWEKLAAIESSSQIPGRVFSIES